MKFQKETDIEMEQQEMITLETAQAETETETDALADLPVEDDAQVKGGPFRLFGDVDGGMSLTSSTNYNETMADDEEAETESLDDLPVDDDEQVKGGPGGNTYRGLTTVNDGVLSVR